MKRQVTIVLGGLIIVGGLFLKKYMASQATPPTRTISNNGAPVVIAKKVINQPVPNKISVSGKLVADIKIEIFSEVQGVLLPQATLFKEGQCFSKGQTLLKIDSAEFYLNLMSSKSSYLNMLVQLGPDIKYDFPEVYESWNNYVAHIDIKKPLPEVPNPTDVKYKNFLTSRDVYKQYYSIKSQEEKLSKYNIEAPFSGCVSEGNLQPGSMVRIGQKIGTYIQSNSFELEVSVNIANTALMDIGDSVLLQSQDLAGKWFGKVERISQHIDQTTQTIKVYVSVSSPELREGMFLSGSILTEGFPKAVVVPREILIGLDELFVIKDSSLVLTEVNVVKIGESEVVIEDLADGTDILYQVFSSAYNGMKVSPKFLSK